MGPDPNAPTACAPTGEPAAAPLQTLELRIELTEDDRPEDRFSHHVNNARYFAFINRTFQAWYRPMGLRDPDAPFTAVMAHVSWDFLRQVMVPGAGGWCMWAWSRPAADRRPGRPGSSRAAGPGIDRDHAQADPARGLRPRPQGDQRRDLRGALWRTRRTKSSAGRGFRVSS
jgi:hypothetical protein